MSDFHENHNWVCVSGSLVVVLFGHVHCAILFYAGFCIAPLYGVLCKCTLADGEGVAGRCIECDRMHSAPQSAKNAPTTAMHSNFCTTLPQAKMHSAYCAHHPSQAKILPTLLGNACHSTVQHQASQAKLYFLDAPSPGGSPCSAEPLLHLKIVLHTTGPPI